jgi:uncharacterized protein YcfJ
MNLIGRSTLIALTAGRLFVFSSEVPVRIDSISARHKSDESTSILRSPTLRGAAIGAVLGAVVGYGVSTAIGNEWGCQSQITPSGQQSSCDRSPLHRARIVVTISGTALGAIIGGVVAHVRAR